MKTILFLPFVIILGFFSSVVNAQYVTVSGYVSDFLTGQTIENATVFEKSSGIGTISGEDGFYKLMLKPGKINITFANNGFESYSQQFNVAADTTVMVKLKSEKWIKSQEKTDSELQTGIEEKKTQGHKKFWFF